MIAVWAAAGLWLGFAAAAASGGASLRAWCAKEGPIEQLSIAVLVACVIAWAVVLRRAGLDRWAAVMLAFTVLVIGEELDWGAVLGVNGLGELLRRAIGHRNLHNFGGGHGYLVFALVPAVAVLFALRRGTSVGSPRRVDALALVVAAVPTALSVWLWSEWADELDEFGELVVYVALLGWAVGAAARATHIADVSPPRARSRPDSACP